MDNKKSLLQKSGIKVNYHCELMQNYVPESIIDSGKGLKTVKDTEDKAFLFFVDTSKTLQVLVHSDQESSGWKMHRISEDGYEVTAFDVHESQNDENNYFRISYARRKDSINQLFVSVPLFVKQIDKEKWNCNYNWDNKIVLDKKREIDHITMDEQGVLYSTNFTKTDASFCYFKYADEPMLYILPENGTKAQQIQLGKANDDFGVFILYYVNDKKTLCFVPLAADEYGERTIERYSTGKDITNEDIKCFDLLPDASGNSVLYVAGKGIYRFIDVETNDGINRHLEELAAPNNDLNFSRLNASQFKEDVALWLIGKSANKSGLFYVNNRTYNNSTNDSQVGNHWTMPLQMHDNTEEFVSVKGPNLINQLYLFGESQDKTEKGLIHFWQDKVSTRWHEQFLNIDNMENTINIESYTIELAFSAEKMSDLIDKEIKISSDENIVIYINNRRQFLIDSTPVGFNINETQMFNLVYPVKSLQASKIILTGDFLDNPIEIDPVSGVMKELSTKLSSVDAIKSAKTKKDKPLVTSTLSDSEWSKVATAISQMGDATERFSTAPSSVALPTAPQPTAPQSEMVTSSVWNWTQNAVGDLFHAVEKGFETITKYTINLIEKGYKIVIEIAGQIFDFIVDTAKKVVAFVEKVFNSIKTFFKDLFEYLAYLFDWDDIIRTKRVLKVYGEQQFEKAKSEVQNYKEIVLKYFEQYKEILKNQEYEIDKKYQSDMMFNSLPKSNGSNGEADPKLLWTASKRNVIFKGGAVNSSGMKNEDIAEIRVKGEENDVPTEIINLFIDFFGGKISISEFCERLLNRIAALAVQLLEYVVGKIFDWVVSIIDLIKKLLYSEIEIPILSYLYKQISKDSLSIADFVALLIAIPMTVGYKLAYNEAPFQEGEEFNFSPVKA